MTTYRTEGVAAPFDRAPLRSIIDGMIDNTSPAHDLDIQTYVTREANVVLQRGSLVLGVLGLACGPAIAVLMALDVLSGVLLPAVTAFIGGVVSFAIYALARRSKMKGHRLYLVFGALTALPTMLFLMSHAAFEGGAAFYITGPFSYLYYLLILITGFLFDRTLSLVMGVSVGLQYFLVYLLASPYLAQVSSPYPELTQDISSGALYAFKAMMIGLSGVMLWALAGHVHKLIRSIVREEFEKNAISRMFGQYVSDEVKEKLLQQREENVSEMKNVVVLFSDIRSFSALSEALPPTQIVAQLNEYFDEMVEAIISHGGVVDKFIGDAVMAVFGGVTELDRPGDAALDAAEDMLRRLDALNAHWTRVGRRPLQIGIGLHYGEVVQGSIGSSSRKEFTVIGDAVNAASRVESLTKEHGFSLLLTESVVRILEPGRRERAVFVADSKVKGKEQTVPVYRAARRHSPLDAVGS